jgi:hypothetical protein
VKLSSPPPRATFAILGAFAAVLSACASGEASPTASVPSTAPSSAAASPEPAVSGGAGLSLAEAELDVLLDAFADYGFEVESEPDNTGTGGNLWTGTAHDGEVELAVIESGGTIEQVGVFDYSAGEVGLDELGFLIGIFAPEAESWLVDQATEAIDNPGTELRAREEFDRVTLEFNAFVDDTDSLDLWVEAPEGGP